LSPNPNGLNLSDGELERTQVELRTTFESGGDGEVGHFSLYGSWIGAAWSFPNLLFTQLSTYVMPVRMGVLRGKKKRRDAVSDE